MHLLYLNYTEDQQKWVLTLPDGLLNKACQQETHLLEEKSQFVIGINNAGILGLVGNAYQK